MLHQCETMSHLDWRNGAAARAGVLAGMVGSAGGIASLVSYPVLLAVGLPAKPANVADTVAFVACLPGSALGSRPELEGQGGRTLRLMPLAVAGSAIGAALLLLTPAGVFGRIVPFLVALAAVALLVQPGVSAWLEKRPGPAAGSGLNAACWRCGSSMATGASGRG